MRNFNKFKVLVLLYVGLSTSRCLYSGIGDTTLLNLFEMSVEDLIEQEVTIATKSTQKVTQSPSVISVITSEEIKAMGPRDLEEILKNIPGITFTQTRLGTRPFEIRGISDIRQGGRLLVLFDGIPYNEVMYGTAFTTGASLNLDNIERIEVIRGPGSALYGRNAFSAVINVITKKAKIDNNFEVDASYGSFNTSHLNTSYEIKKKQFNSFLTAKYYTTDGTSSTFDNGMGGEGHYNLTHDNFYLNGNAEYKNFRFSGAYYYLIDGVSAGPYMTNGNNQISLGTYNLNYSKIISSKFAINAKIYGQNLFRIQNLEQYKPNTTALHPVYKVPISMLAPEGIYARPLYDAYFYGSEVYMNYKLLKNNELLFGFQGDFHGVKNTSVSSNYDLATNVPLTYVDSTTGNVKYYTKDNMPQYGPNWIQNSGHDYTSLALYVQDVHYFLPNLSLTLGGRLDFDSEVGHIFNPRLGMVWEPFNWAWMKVLYGEAFRAPTTNEQYKIMGFDKGNEKLKYEEIKTTEISFGTKFNRMFSQISLYYNQLENLILQQPINDSSKIKTYYNTGTNISYGIEAETRFFISTSLYSYVSYSYCQSEDTKELFGKKETIPHPNVAYHKANFGINYLVHKKISIGVFSNYVGPITKFKNSAYDPSDLASSEFISQDKVGDYILLNSSIRFSNILKGFDISIYGYNLLNQEYFFQDDENVHQPAQPKIHFLIKVCYSIN